MVDTNKIISDIQKFAAPDTTLADFCDTVDYSRSVVIYRFDSWTNAKKMAGLDVRCLECPNCGNFYSSISNHWNKCGEPYLTQKHKSILVGAFLSDATVSDVGTMTMYSSNKEFLDWLSDELSFMAYDALLNDSGEDRHRRNIKSGFDTNRNANYNDMYMATIPRHSFTENMSDWYGNDGKFIPKNISVDKNLFKIWYCGDGGLNWSEDKRAYAELRPISFDNSAIRRIVDKFGLNYSIQKSGTVCFYGDTEKFLDYIGPAPKGMEYKWETGSRERYNRLKP